MPNQPPDHRHSHAHSHSHGSRHASLWLARQRPGRPVHRVGRRQFLTELGRNTFAIAILGGVVVACSNDDDDDGDASEPTPSSPPTDTSAPADTGTRWAQARLGSVSAYVLVRGSEAAVVDTGNPGSTAEIGNALATLGAVYDDVRHVVITHSHPDHIGSLDGVLEAAPVATPYAGALDIPNITSPVEVSPVGDGDDVFGLQVIDTPGHTPGSISVFDPGIGLLLAGDALNGNDDGTGLSGPNERFTPDMATANSSVVKLASLEVDAVGMGHGQPVESDAGPLLTSLAASL